MLLYSMMIVMRMMIGGLHDFVAGVDIPAAEALAVDLAVVHLILVDGHRRTGHDHLSVAEVSFPCRLLFSLLFTCVGLFNF